MDRKDNPRFCQLMMGLAENFRDQISEAGLKLRWRALENYSIEEIESAAFKIIKRRHFTKMPTIGEFITEINGRQASAEDAAELAWQDVISQIRAVGSYGQPVYADEITRQLMAGRFSFMALCRMTERELSWMAKEFIEAYLANEGGAGRREERIDDGRTRAVAENMLKVVK
jgi:hypothetical protein